MHRPARSVAFVFVAVLAVLAALPMSAQTVFINEIHYDDSTAAGDTGEAVEVAGPAGTDLTGWSIVLYNGSGGASYDTDALTGTIPNLCGGYGVVYISYPTNGIQNGAPDGVALVNSSGTVVQFLSYEGVFTATNGPANGMTSTDIGVAETNSTTPGFSLRLSGTGSVYTDFVWQAPAANTFGACNTGQTFVAPDVAPTVSSTSPANGATGVALNSNLTVTFSEAVNVAGAWYGISCASSGSHTAAVSGGPTTFTINPDVDFTGGEACTVTIVASQVSDQDGTANPMAANYVFSFTAVSPNPNLTVNDVTAAEGNSGTTTFTFTVSLSAPAPAGGVTFDIATADGTATQPSDYTAKSLTGQTIPAGSSTYTFDVLVKGDTTVEPNETFFVNVTNATNAVVTDGQGQGTITNDDFTPIHDIQGNGLTSPLVGQAVTTRGVVTALKYNNGFFLQEPDATVDADPATSEGVFVYTGSAPTVAIGDFVTVIGTVSEYNQASTYGVVTELVAPLTINVVSTGNPLPAPVAITAAMTSPAGSWEQLENLEGMRVSVAGFTVTAATDGNPGGNYTTGTSYGDCYGVVPGVDRPFREAGIAFPKVPPVGTTIPPLLRFDSNPETLRVDTDGQVGATRQNFSARTVLPGFVGVLDYGFSRYSILPDVGSLPAGPAEFLPTPVTAPTATEFTVASYNLQRFFDDTNDPDISEPVLTSAQYQARLNKASVGIRNYMRMPDVVGVIEMENLATLQALAARINNDAVVASQPDPQYVAYLVEGNDVGGIDVGFLVKTATVGANPRVEVLTVTQELDGTLFTNPDTSTETLNDRPPLMLRAVIHAANGGAFPVTVIVNHLRSMNDVDNDAAGSNGWATIGERVRAKRQAQAVDLATFVQARQAADPAERIILVGDFNAFSVNDSLGDLVATICGTPAPDATTAAVGDGADLVNPDLVNLGPLGAPAERYSYVFDFTAQMIDQGIVNAALVNASLARRVEFARINADFPEIDRSTTDARLSDHDPLVIFVESPTFLSAGVAVTVADAPDPVFPSAGLTYTIDVTNGGPDAASGVTLTDVLPAGTVFASLTPAGGWSCTTPAVGAAGTVSCSIASLANGSSASFTLNVTVGALAAGTLLSNTATVATVSSDPSSADNTATATTTVQTPPALYATKAVTGVGYPGAPITYTVTIYNNGSTAQADNAGDELVDVLPASLTLVSATATSGTVVATVATNTVTWNGSVPAGGSVTVTIEATISASAALGEVVANQASVSYDADGNGSNESSALTDDPATGTFGDPTVITITRGAGANAVVPTLGGPGLAALALLVALGGALVLGRRIA